MSSAAHVLIDTDDSPDAAGFCAHCGERMVFKMPMDMTLFVKRIGAFVTLHEDCPKPEVLHARKEHTCVHCNEKIARDPAGGIDGLSIGVEDDGTTLRYSHMDCMTKS